MEETIEWDGRVHRLRWIESPVHVPVNLVRQVSAVCFASPQEIILVSGDGLAWGLPGGRPEPGETVEDALVREVHEEACAVVESMECLGAVLVEDPEWDDGYYQLRFCALVSLLPFKPRYETSFRVVVSPGEFVTKLAWGRSVIAHRLIEKASESFMRLSRGDLHRPDAGSDPVVHNG